MRSEPTFYLLNSGGWKKKSKRTFIPFFLHNYSESLLTKRQERQVENRLRDISAIWNNITDSKSTTMVRMEHLHMLTSISAALNKELKSFLNLAGFQENLRQRLQREAEETLPPPTREIW